MRPRVNVRPFPRSAALRALHRRPLEMSGRERVSTRPHPRDCHDRRMTEQRTGPARPADGFTAEEKAAMKQAVAEKKRTAAGKNTEDDVLAAIGAMDDFDRPIAEGLHALVKRIAPELTCRTWYGFPPTPATPRARRSSSSTSSRPSSRRATAPSASTTPHASTPDAVAERLRDHRVEQRQRGRRHRADPTRPGLIPTRASPRRAGDRKSQRVVAAHSLEHGHPRHWPPSHRASTCRFAGQANRASG